MMHSYWWFKPHIVCGLCHIPLLLVAALIPGEWYLHLGGAPKFLNLETVTVGLGGILFFMGGAWLGARPFSRFPKARNNPLPLSVSEITYRLAMYSVLLLALAAYVIWMRHYLADPYLIVPILKGEPGAIYMARDIAERMPGITSFTNVSALYVVLYALYSKVTGASLKMWDKLAMGVFLFFSVARVLIYSERLALIWVVIPFALAALGCARRHRQLIVVLPVLFVVLFVPFFALSEYFRAWSNHYVNHWDSFWGYVFFRLFTYYVTALNNGAGVFEIYDTYYAPVVTAAWAWKFPVEIFPGGIGALLNIDRDDHLDRFLTSFANPEYNNDSGLFGMFVDFGAVVGTVAWGILGWLSGQLYHRFLKSTAVGLLLYPSWYVCVLEIPRWFAFGSTRVFPLFIITFIVAWIFTAENASDRHG